MILARGDLRFETAALDGQRERALLFLACAHAARAHDALRRIETEIRIGFVDVRVQMVRAVETVANLGHADRFGHAFHFGVEAFAEIFGGMIRQIQLHHAFADFAELLVLRRDLHALRHRRRARSRIAFHAFDLHEAQTARAERIEQFGGAQFRDVDADGRRRAHHGRAFGHADVEAVDGQRDLLLGFFLRRAEVQFNDG